MFAMRNPFYSMSVGWISLLGAQELIQVIHSSVLAFLGTPELRDDFTLVVLKLPAENPAPNNK
jgi:hypothetical protein